MKVGLTAIAALFVVAAFASSVTPPLGYVPAASVLPGIVTATNSATVATTTSEQRCNIASVATMMLNTIGMQVGQEIWINNLLGSAAVCTFDAGVGNTMYDTTSQTEPLNPGQSDFIRCITVIANVCKHWDEF